MYEVLISVTICMLQSEGNLLGNIVHFGSIMNKLLDHSLAVKTSNENGKIISEVFIFLFT
jgi:hypothetical protein